MEGVSTDCTKRVVSGFFEQRALRQGEIPKGNYRLRVVLPEGRDFETAEASGSSLTVNGFSLRMMNG